MFQRSFKRKIGPTQMIELLDKGTNVKGSKVFECIFHVPRYLSRIKSDKKGLIFNTSF